MEEESSQDRVVRDQETRKPLVEILKEHMRRDPVAAKKHLQRMQKEAWEKQGSSLLGNASAIGDEKLVTFLLTNDFIDDLNAVDKYSKTPLYIACEGGHVDVAIKLLTFGADTKKSVYVVLKRVLQDVYDYSEWDDIYFKKVWKNVPIYTTASEIAKTSEVRLAIKSHIELKKAINAIQTSYDADNVVLSLLTQSFKHSPDVLFNFVKAVCELSIENPFKDDAKWQLFIKNIYQIECASELLTKIHFKLGYELYGQKNDLSVLFLEKAASYDRQAEILYDDAYRKLLNLPSKEIYFGQKPSTTAELKKSIKDADPQRVLLAEAKFKILEEFLLDPGCFHSHIQFAKQKLEPMRDQVDNPLDQTSMAKLYAFVGEAAYKVAVNNGDYKSVLLHRSRYFFKIASKSIDVGLNLWKINKELDTGTKHSHDDFKELDTGTKHSHDDFIVTYKELEHDDEDQSLPERQRSASF